MSDVDLERLGKRETGDTDTAELAAMTADVAVAAAKKLLRQRGLGKIIFTRVDP